jgi:hypothetical protein
MRFFTLLLISVFLSGCSFFLPKHPNSLARDGERIEVNMLTKQDICNHYKDAYKSAFSKDDIYMGVLCNPPKKEDEKDQYFEPITISAAATVAVGMAIDAVSSELQREASDYEAQFKRTEAFDSFWIKTNPKQSKLTTTVESTECATPPYQENDKKIKQTKSCKDINIKSTSTTEELKYDYQYFGVEVIRKIKGESEPVFRFALGLSPSSDKKMFQMKPMFFQTTKSKAKVLSDEPWTWLPPTVFGKMFRDSGHSIDTDINFQIDAYWHGLDQLQHTSTLAASTFTISDYDIEKGEPITEISGGSGWLLSVPVSYDSSGKPAGDLQNAGTFSVQVLVTEKDHSNAKQYLEQGAQYLKDNKSDIVNKVGYAFSH